MYARKPRGARNLGGFMRDILSFLRENNAIRRTLGEVPEVGQASHILVPLFVIITEDFSFTRRRGACEGGMVLA
jgi:hypothetical protein